MISSSAKTRVAIVGAGISGLSAAYRLTQLSGDQLDITIFDRLPRAGGVLESQVIGDFRLETSADMFSIDPPAALELCHELKLGDSLLSAKPTPDRAYIAVEDGVHPVPRGFSLMLPGNIDAVLESKILSDEAKQRFLQEESIPPQAENADESLESFATRRFGREVFERLIQPLASGIYTADPRMLSMRATMDRFLQLEKKHGSLIAAAKQQTQDVNNQTSGARYGLFRAPENGLGELVEALTRVLNHQVTWQLETAVKRIDRQPQQWELTCSSGRDGSITDNPARSFDGVITSTSARLASSLLNRSAPQLANQLNSIEAASSAIVAMGIRRDQLAHDFPGYGIIIPHSLGRKAIACSFSSNKFDQRAPEDQLLIRVFFGGALNPELVELADSELLHLATEELDRLLDFSGKPIFWRVIRWHQCMPQYTHGHLARIAAIESEVSSLPGLELAGNSYRGVGIPACIESGFGAAERLLHELGVDR